MHGKRSTICAGPALIELIDAYTLDFPDIVQGEPKGEIILLKQPKPKRSSRTAALKDYTDNATTYRYRAELRAINQWLASAEIDFDAEHALYERRVDVRARWLYRSFTQGRFDCGGRLFGGFWENLPKEVRLRGLLIEGDAVIGLDFKNMNVILAYAAAKATPPDGDAYVLPGLENYREGVKRIFNSLMFGAKGKRYPEGVAALFPDTVKIGDVVKSLYALQKLFMQPRIGHQLQNLESEIMMSILKRCQHEGIVALPVHDCILVKSALQWEAKSVMQREFRKHTGLKPEVHSERLKEAVRSQEYRLS